MTKAFEDYSYNGLTEKDLLSKRNKMIFLSQNQQKDENNILSISKYEENAENSGIEGKLNKYISSRRNFVLKSEICKNINDNEDTYSNKNNKIQCNALINYYYNTNIFQQNKNGNYTLINNFNSNEKVSQVDNNISWDNNINRNDKDFNNNTNININNNINNSNNFKNANRVNENQINSHSPLINNIYNIIKTNNYYYPNRVNMNINYTNNKSFNSQVLIIKDKFGCVMMKNKILSDPNYANEILFPQIKEDLQDLCCDNFGN